MFNNIASPGKTSYWKGFAILSKLLGSLLIAAAILKIYGLAVDPLLQDGLVNKPWLHITSIEIEFLLGMWLLSGLAQKSGWLISIVTFGILTGISLYQALTGQASCGCFGQVKVSPWITFVVDTCAILALLFFRPAFTQDKSETAFGDPQRKNAWLKYFMQLTALVVFLFGLVVMCFFFVER